MFRNWTASSSDVYDHWLEQIDAAESLGFDSLWVTEHHFRYFGGMMPSPSVILAAAAQRTKKMRLGAAVSIFPDAQSAAHRRRIRHGRPTFRRARELRRRSRHASDRIRRSSAMTGTTRKTAARGPRRRHAAWSGGDFEWNGEHYQFPKLRVYPKPRQQPHPPIYVTANRDPESFKMIGRRGHHLMTLPWVATNEEQRPRVEIYLAALRDGGHRT